MWKKGLIFFYKYKIKQEGNIVILCGTNDDFCIFKPMMDEACQFKNSNYFLKIKTEHFLTSALETINAIYSFI